MTNHPNRGRFTPDEIRAYLVERYNAEAVKTGAEGDEAEAGLYHGDADAWVVLGKMPNTNQDGWFFAGYSGEIVRDMRAERE